MPQPKKYYYYNTPNSKERAMNLPRIGWADCIKKASDSEYHEYSQRLTEQFINGLEDEAIIGEIFRELMHSKKSMRPSATTLIWDKS